MEIWILNYTDNCVDKLTPPEQDDVQKYLDEVGYKDKDIAWLADVKPITVNKPITHKNKKHAGKNCK